MLLCDDVQQLVEFGFESSLLSLALETTAHDLGIDTQNANSAIIVDLAEDPSHPITTS